MVSFLQCLQQPPLNQEEALPKMVQDSMSKIEMQDGVEKRAAKKRRVRKNLFPCNEASSSEPTHQLQQEEKCQKPVNSAANKSYDIAISNTFRTMLSVRQTGRITARDMKTKGLLLLQSHKVGDVIRTGNNIEKGGVIVDALNLEMEKDESPDSVTQNIEVLDGKIRAGKPSSRNFVDMSEKPKQTHGHETVPVPSCITSYKKSHKIMNKHVGVKKSDTRENVKQATGFPVLTPHSSQVCKTHMVTKSQSITATNCPSCSSSNTDYKASSKCVCQGQKNKIIRQSLGKVQAETDVICISDSDDEIEWLCSKYNPKLDYKRDRKKQALKKNRQSAVKTEDNFTPKQTHISPKSYRCVQRNIPTCGMGAASSTVSSVSTLPHQSQTLVTNPNNNTTHLTDNQTVKVEEEFPVMHNHVGPHTVAENQDSVSETVLTVQPSGSSHSVSGTSVLQTESIEHVQSHIPGLSTAKTVLSPIPSYSTHKIQNVTLRTQDTLMPKQTHNAPKSNPCVQKMVPTSEMGAASSTGSSVNTLPHQSQTVGTNPNNNTTYLTHNSTVIHDKVKEEFPVMHNHVGTHTAAGNQGSVSEAVFTVQPSGSSHSVSGNAVLQPESTERVQSHIPGLNTAKTVLSPIPSYSTQKIQNVPVRTQDTLSPNRMHNAPKSNPCVQRMVPTSEMEAAASTGSSVATLPQYFQTPVTNPDNNTTYLTHNSTVIHDNIEEGFPVDHRNVGIHTATEKQNSGSEAVLTVHPSGSSHHVSGNSVLQTESVEHVQRHIPGLNTANTILSPLPLSSPQSNPNIPVHHLVAAGETITSVQHSSSMSNGPVHSIQINVPSHVPGSQGSNIYPYIFVLGSTPGTSVMQVTTDTTNRPPHAHTRDIISDAQIVRTNSPGFNSSTSSRIPYPQLTQTRIPTPQLVDPLVDRARNYHFPVYQTNDNQPVAVTSSHLPSVQTRNPGFSSTPTEHSHTQHPHSLLANTRVPDIHLSSHTPEGQTRIPGTPLTKTRNSVTTAVQTRSPGTPVAHTSSTGAVLGKTRSLGTPMACTNSAGTVLGKTRSPGTAVAYSSSSGTVLGKTRSPGTPVAHTSSSGIVLGKTTSPGTTVAHTHNSGTVLGKTGSPGKICFSQASRSGVSVVQARNSGSLFRAQTPVAYVNPDARLPHGRGHPSSRPERDWTGVVQQRNQTARLVVIPGDDNVSRYGLVFPSGAKVILTPEQVAEIRAANGGLLTSNFGM